MTATEVAGAAKDHLKARAAKLAPRDTYPLLNEARIESISELDADVTAALAQVRSLIVDRSGIGSGPMTG